jgi:murein hydrolase activator
MLRPISGELVGPARAGAAIPEPGITLQSRVSQMVSAPSGGRVVFAGPFPGSGSLLIIDRGGGYHVLMTGLARLDVREGASVVAGQAVGEIVAQGDEPARLYLELRYRGVPLDPAPRLAAREDKVRS